MNEWLKFLLVCLMVAAIIVLYYFTVNYEVNDGYAPMTHFERGEAE